VTSEQPAVRLYGGWRRSRTLGIAHLSTGQTAVVVLSVLGPLLMVNIAGFSSLLTTVPLALVLIALTLWQVHGMPLLHLALARGRWQWATWRGETSYRALFQPHPRALDLPGVLAPTCLLRVEDASGTSVGVVWNRSTGQMSASLLLAPGGALLADRSTVDATVTAWGSVLAGLATESAVDSATVTIQVTPSTGAALSDHVRRRSDPAAPALAKATLRELIAATPHASSTLAAWMTLVVSPHKAADRPATPPEAAAEVLRCLDCLDLGGAGADIQRRATENDLLRLVRGAYNPGDLDAPEAEIAALTWDAAGPSASEDRWTEYHHDGHVSFTLVLREAPRRPVNYGALLPLLAPGRYSRRLTMAYRILAPEEGASVVEREVSAADARAMYNTRTQRTSTRRERADAEAADRNAIQEAHGAGIAQWTTYVTVTVSDPNDLPAARRELEQAAKRSAGLRFRPAFGGQAAAFVGGLPVGVHPLA